MTDRHSRNTPANVACDGKDKLTYSRAQEVAGKMRAGAYHCGHCGHWHVGRSQRHSWVKAAQRKPQKPPRPRDYDEE